MKMNKSYGCISVHRMLFVFLFITSCGQDELPSATLTGRFQVNISSTAGLGQPLNEKIKTLEIDGDSIRFSTKYYNAGYYTVHYFLIEPTSNNLYEYVTKIDTTPFAFLYTEFFPANISSEEIPTNIQQWRPIKDTMSSQLLLYGSSIFGWPNLLDLPYNQDQYIIFRKEVQNNYMYFWVRMRYIPNYLLYTFTLTILDGKYQMGSIITGL